MHLDRDDEFSSVHAECGVAVVPPSGEASELIQICHSMQNLTQS